MYHILKDVVRYRYSIGDRNITLCSFCLFVYCEFCTFVLVFTTSYLLDISYMKFNVTITRWRDVLNISLLLLPQSNYFYMMIYGYCLVISISCVQYFTFLYHPHAIIILKGSRLDSNEVMPWTYYKLWSTTYYLPTDYLKTYYTFTTK